jgi:heat shock protein HslJ
MHPATRRRHTSRLVLVLFAAMAIAVAACGSASSTPVATLTPGPTSAPSSAPLELAGTNWSLIEYASPSGEILTVPAAVTPTAEFTADTMSGRAGCNTFTAGYTLDGDNFTLTGISSTMMACEGPVATVETAYLQALAVLDKAALLDDGRLQLWDVQGKTTLVYVQGG